MNTGTYISGGAHVALILWLMFGGYLGSSEPPEPPQAAEVSLISAQELAALSLPQQNPDATLDVPVPQLPEIDTTQTPVPRTPDAAVATDSPDSQPPSDPDAVPTPPEDLTPPPAEVTDQTAVLLPPTPDISVPELTPRSDTPQPSPAPRVAPIPVPEAPLNPEIADTASPRISPARPRPARCRPRGRQYRNRDRGGNAIIIRAHRFGPSRRPPEAASAADRRNAAHRAARRVGSRRHC